MIGVFDSGLGGLTVVKELQKQLPDFDIVYFGDNARYPYGNKGEKIVKQFAVEDAKFLEAQGADIIIVACNTASAVAMEVLQEEINIPIFEVVQPAVAEAMDKTRGKVGVIGTVGTVSSGVYERRMQQLSPDVQVLSHACPLFVPMVEEGWHESDEVRSIAKAYLNPLILGKIDTLILGCTHYPFLHPVIKEVVGDGVTLVDPARETVKSLKAWLDKNPDPANKLSRSNASKYYVSDTTSQFEKLASDWLGTSIELKQIDISLIKEPWVQ